LRIDSLDKIKKQEEDSASNSSSESAIVFLV